MITNEICTTKEEKILNLDEVEFLEIYGQTYVKEHEKSLIRYNEKYKKLVEIKFVENLNIHIDNIIVDTLSSQYIERMIHRR